MNLLSTLRPRTSESARNMRIITSQIDAIELGFRGSDGEETSFAFDLKAEETSLMPLFAGPAWSAIIWERSVLAMCGFLEANPTFTRDKYVVELGCGLGVPGLVSAITCGAAHVVLTDREEDLIFLRRALVQNKDKPRMSHVEAVSYDWSVDAPAEVKEKAQVILAVECVSADVYGRESLGWLITAIEKAASKTESKVLLLLCSARRKDDGLEEVLQMIEKRFKTTPRIVPEFSKGDVELHMIELDLRSG